jgi:hypothetical protein
MDDKDIKMIFGLITGLENIIGLLLRNLIGNNTIDRDATINALKEMMAKIEADGKDADGMERFPIMFQPLPSGGRYNAGAATHPNTNPHTSARHSDHQSPTTT